MGVFFKDTVFLKDDCDLEKEIAELESLRGKVKDEGRLDKYIRTLNAGLNGERAIEFELKNARIGMYVLHDINIQYQDQNSQIDYVIVTPVFCYLVECKNMIGDITVDSKGEFVRKLPWGSKEAIYSPLRQARRHVDLLKKIRDDSRGLLGKALLSLSKDDYYQPLVVVANANGILNTKYAVKEDKKRIVKVDGLIDYLNRHLEGVGWEYLDSRSGMERIARSILELNVPKDKNNWTDRFELNEETGSGNDEALRNELLEYRKTQSKQRNYPAYYIFTNDQLERLIKERPQTIAELKNILEPVKVKIYGDDLIRVINKDHQ